MKNKIKWIIFSICLIMFIVIAFNIGNESLKIDNFVYNFISSFRTDFNTKIAKIITNMGYYYLIPIAAIIMVIFVFVKRRKTAFLIGLNIFITGILNLILKNIFRRNRPFTLMIIDQKGYSFPSGHAMASTAFYGFFIYLIYKKVNNKYLKWSLILLLSLLIILICSSRIYLGVHFTSDVIAGMMLSICELIIFTSVVEKYFEVK